MALKKTSLLFLMGLALAVAGCNTWRPGDTDEPPTFLVDKNLIEDGKINPDIRLKAGEINTFFVDEAARQRVHNNVDQILATVPDPAPDLRDNIEILINKEGEAHCEVYWMLWTHKHCIYFTSCFVVDANHRILGRFLLPGDLEAFRLGTLQTSK